jgi:hypothetical protein
LSATINLGKITTGKLSLFTIKATSTQNVILSYEYKEGRLPPGLSIAVDGGVQGKCGTDVFDVDNGLTTFDNGNTTTDRDYVFTVKATGQFGNVSSEQSFKITVLKDTHDEISNVFGQIFVDETQRDAFTNFVTDNKLFPNDDLFRPYDLNFDTKFPKFLFLSGVHLKFLSELQSYLKNNTYDFTLRFGEFKVAQAKDDIGDVLYDVIYAELEDPKTGANKFTNYNTKLPNILSQIRADSLGLLSDMSMSIPGGYVKNLYSNDIINMQDEIKNQTTVENYKYLPRWMQSYQNDNQVLGYKIVLPIKFVKPGQGAKVLYRIQNQNTYDIQTLTASFDRWIFDNNLGTKFNFDTTVTDTGDGSTVSFNSPYKITKPQQVVVTLDDEITSSFVISFPVTSDTAEITTDSAVLSTDIQNPSTTRIVFATAPGSGVTIVVKLKETTFGKKVVTTFDTSISATADTNLVKADEELLTADGLDLPLRFGQDDVGEHTTFDNNGTRFIGEEVTFDRKSSPETQLLFNNKSILDNITTVSKQRKLVRSL